MKKIITTTTINGPTEEIRKYDAMPDWELVVVGDRKTPKYPLARGTYLDWKYQKANYPDICKLVGPDNTIRGRMISFIEAYRRGADIVASIDDDCMPYDNWPGEIYLGKETTADHVVCNEIVFDPYTLAFDVPHRGFPPQLWGRKSPVHMNGPAPITPLIQAGLIDGQADIDSTWRFCGMINQGDCRATKPYWTKAFSPFDPQNTLAHRDALRDYCGEIPFVGHVSDIWAAYLFEAYQPGRVLYTPATVRHWQDRSYDSILNDLADEVYSYRFGLDYLQTLAQLGPKGINEVLPSKAVDAIGMYREYFK